jgi:hypothetical protein
MLKFIFCLCIYSQFSVQVSPPISSIYASQVDVYQQHNHRSNHNLTLNGSNSLNLKFHHCHNGDTLTDSSLTSQHHGHIFSRRF